MYFGAFPNSANKTAYERQQSHYELMPVDKLSKVTVGQKVIITGYGTAKGDRNQVQQTHSGLVFEIAQKRHTVGYRVSITRIHSI